MALESLQVNDQDGRSLEYLYLLHCLLMLLALVAVPSILLTQLLMSQELLEAVVYGDPVSNAVHDLVLLVGEDLAVLLEPHQILKERPTLVGVEVNL
jgi:hypothetical protein